MVPSSRSASVELAWGARSKANGHSTDDSFINAPPYIASRVCVCRAVTVRSPRKVGFVTSCETIPNVTVNRVNPVKPVNSLASGTNSNCLLALGH